MNQPALFISFLDAFHASVCFEKRTLIHIIPYLDLEPGTM
jgi:hypothetical protein